MSDVSEPVWVCASAAVAGARHAARGEPCQDAAASRRRPRPYCIVCDGKGSSTVSQHGSSAAILRMRDLVRLLDPILAPVLDGEHTTDADGLWRAAAKVIVRLLGEVQVRLASESGRAAKDYEFTLATAIVGQRHVGWVQVGDAVLVAEVGGALGLLAPPWCGEFSNQTLFVGPKPTIEEHVATGLIPVTNLHGIAALSDGAAYHFVQADTLVPAEVCRGVLHAVSRNKCGSSSLEAFLGAARWSQRHGDDRAFAVIARSSRDRVVRDAVSEGAVLSEEERPEAPGLKVSNGMTEAGSGSVNSAGNVSGISQGQLPC